MSVCLSVCLIVVSCSNNKRVEAFWTVKEVASIDFRAHVLTLLCCSSAAAATTSYFTFFFLLFCCCFVFFVIVFTFTCLLAHP